ncbi:coiled-coil domain-containing protein [Dethiosulfovibrio salsuginis]|uniref:Uncharacterized protein n=1 Tax=Dethiosulfovibrio salsuginis TaxID=561720 RepID=A0A1X7IJS3_9BACT|nr:hypothetical protein [Dethiosulfovibrio salsuginis]SMG14998.1 hypothetical protein SAMN06275492_1032 [Dethiosulfovibrio salsuginis]
MSKNKRNSLDEEKKNIQTGKVQEGGAPKDMSSGAFQEDVWDADSAQSCTKEKKCATPEDESPLASITNWFNGLQLFNQDGDKKDKGPKTGNSGSNGGSDGGEGNKFVEDMKEELTKNWRKYAIVGLVLLILFNVVWTLMDSRIGSVADEGAKQAAAVQELKKELEAVKATLADKVTAMDEAIKGAGVAIEGIQGSLTTFEEDLKAFDEKASDDRMVIARHDEYIRQTVADRKAELRKYARDLRVYESLLGEGGAISLPSVPMVAAAAVMEEAVGPVKSTLQLTQDSLSITRDTLAITRDSLEKTRADLLKKEKDNAALTADLESSRRDLLALETKVAELERKYKDQSLDLSQTKADLAVSEKEASDLKLEISKTQGSLREEIEKAKEALNAKGAEIESVQATLAERDEQVKALEAKVAELEASLNEKSEALSSVTEELNAVKEDSTAKAKDLSEKSGLFETVQKELEELKASSESMKADFEKSMEEKEAALTEAKAKVEELVEKLKNFEGLSEKNVEEVEALKQALEMKQAELNEAIASIRAHEERQKALEDKLMILENQAPAAPAEAKPAS